MLGLDTKKPFTSAISVPLARPLRDERAVILGCAIAGSVAPFQSEEPLC
jgi:hypothetical protein